MILNVDDALRKTLAYLSSPIAVQSLERDPYWPKWDGPWWHMLLLHEMGLVKVIPSTIIAKMVEILKEHYLTVFPIKQEEVPAGIDPYRQLACHCAVGSIYQVLFDYGIEVDDELPWMRPWFLRYQLPDGGLNCDEQAYTKQTPKSSIVSTLPCLEAVLFCHKHHLTPQEMVFLDRGANYLLRQKLFRKVSSGEVIRQDWREIKFPRFYEYDFLRGFYFLAKWREQSGLPIPDELVEEVEILVEHQMTSEGLKLKRYNLFDKRSYNPGTNEFWAWGLASEFDLMKAVSFDGAPCSPLTKKWNEVKLKNATVIESYETIYKNPIKLKVGQSVRIEKRETNPEWLGWLYC
ncbi:MAG: hypothetical protein AABY86_05670, partial [Bdellovibrionota bacterium]